MDIDRTYRRDLDVIQGTSLVIGDDFAPYDFLSWRECCNFLIDKCYGMKHAMELIKKDNEHLELRCPLTGEYLTVLASPSELQNIHNNFVVQGLYRRIIPTSDYKDTL